jgi:membrane-associated phospholipid phosphatase
MVAFSFATVLAEQYSDKRWVPWVAYGAAGLIAYARVAQSMHWPSDVIVGAVLGNSIGRMVVARSRGEKGAIPGRIEPLVDPVHQGYGVGWSYEW